MSDIPEPKFSIGEEVLVFSKHLRPGTWFEEVIIERIWMPNGWVPPNAGFVEPGWRYEFSSISHAHEKNIRKKHKGAGSWDQLIADLKNPSHVAGPVGVEE